MKSSQPSFASPATRRGFLSAAAAVLGLLLLPLAVLHAADPLPALPVSTTFAKVSNPGGAPMVLTVTNTSKSSVTLSGKVLLSVVNHAMDKARALPEHTVKAGESWTIPDLTPEDKVILTAPGFESLTVKVPY